MLLNNVERVQDHQKTALIFVLKTFLTQLKILYSCRARVAQSGVSHVQMKRISLKKKENSLDISIKAIECDITTVPSGLDKRA